MEFARIGDVALHHAHITAPLDNTGEAPTIVFANSLGSDCRIWDEVIADLAVDYGVVLYDKRGHGLSDIGPIGEKPASHAMADHVGDLAGLLDHLEVSNAIICGLSVGGMIAQGLYASRPDLVRALVLCDTAHRIGSLEAWNARIEAVTRDGIASIAGSILERWFTPAFRDEANPEFAGARNMLVRTPVEGYVGTCAALRDTDYTDLAGRIDVPVMCVVGAEDGSTPPELVRSLADLVPGARFEVIEDAAHLPCIERPDVFADLIRDFISDLETH
ncbi:MAG: 3-oxoadipate enol-lactonase [Nitratireductor sp.]|nr:3-oxoadipate enol-lactonase [Nitratireductor sp.]